MTIPEWLLFHAFMRSTCYPRPQVSVAGTMLVTWNCMSSYRWSVGILLYEMLCGKPPFKAKSRPQLQKQILGGKLKLPRTYSPLRSIWIFETWPWAVIKRPRFSFVYCWVALQGDVLSIQYLLYLRELLSWGTLWFSILDSLSKATQQTGVEESCIFPPVWWAELGSICSVFEQWGPEFAENFTATRPCKTGGGRTEWERGGSEGCLLQGYKLEPAQDGTDNVAL